jgi:hypothetical protein
MLAATTQATEVSDLKWRLQLADDDIDRMNKRCDEAQGMFEIFRTCLN